MIANFITWLQAFLESALELDYGVLDFLQNYLANPIMDKVMAIITLFGEAGIFWIAIAVICLFFRRTRRTGWAMGVAMVIGLLVCNVWLKNAVARCRPLLDSMPDKHDASRIVQGWFSNFTHEGVDVEHIKEVWSSTISIPALNFAYSLEPHDFSFPSGHTIASFEACTVLMIRNKWAGIPATILAVLIAFSRMYLYIHYPTDVITSVFLGILFGLLGCLIVAIIYHFIPDRAAVAKPRRGKGRFLAK